MQQQDTNHEPAVGPEVDPSASSAPRQQQGIAKVLERAIAPDLVPPVVTLGDLQRDTATYIAEFADIARHKGPRAASGAVCPGIMLQDMPQET